MIRLVLASGSPRRVELLSLLGVPFEVRPSDIDEARRPGEDPRSYVERLAREKAATGVAPGVLSLGADTAVVLEGHVLGKPAHPAEAKASLRRLSGHPHEVVTGVAVAVHDGSRILVESMVETAVVRMRDLTDDEIHAYVATGEPLDKAGSYALQERGGILVADISGHPSTVAGLPLAPTRLLLQRHGIPTVV